MKLWSCDNCHVIVAHPHQRCPSCDLEDATYTGADPEGGFTTEQKEAVHAAAQAAATHEYPTMCWNLYREGVLEPMARGEKVPEALADHYLAGFAAALTVGAYAKALGLELDAFAFQGEERSRVVEDTVRHLYEEGFDVKAAYREGDAKLASRLRRRDDGLTREDVDRAIRLLEVGAMLHELTENQQKRILERAEGIDLEVYHGHHEEHGRWVGSVSMQEAEQRDAAPAHEILADKAEEDPAVMSALFQEADDGLFTGEGLLVAVVEELLERGRAMSFDREELARLARLLDAADVEHHTAVVRCSGKPDLYLLAPSEDVLDQLIPDSAREGP